MSRSSSNGQRRTSGKTALATPWMPSRSKSSLVMAATAMQRRVLATYARRVQLLINFLGPYNAIHVGAAAPNVPSTLVNQLTSPGRMFIPVGVYMQDVQQIDKDENDRVTQQPIMSVSVSYCLFLPMHPEINLYLAIVRPAY